MNEYKARNSFTEDFKMIATVDIEMKKLHKLVMENLGLNSMKGLTVITLFFEFSIFRRNNYFFFVFSLNIEKCVAHKFGMIIYSDEITIDACLKCRIMMLDKAIICVRTRISTVCILFTYDIRTKCIKDTQSMNLIFF